MIDTFLNDETVMVILSQIDPGTHQVLLPPHQYKLLSFHKYKSIFSGNITNC